MTARPYPPAAVRHVVRTGKPPRVETKLTIVKTGSARLWGVRR